MILRQELEADFDKWIKEYSEANKMPEGSTQHRSILLQALNLYLKHLNDVEEEHTWEGMRLWIAGYFQGVLIGVNREFNI